MFHHIWHFLLQPRSFLTIPSKGKLGKMKKEEFERLMKKRELIYITLGVGTVVFMILGRVAAKYIFIYSALFILNLRAIYKKFLLITLSPARYLGIILACIGMVLFAAHEEYLGTLSFFAGTILIQLIKE